MKNKAVFLDRDGTLNVDYGYVHKKEDWKWIDGVIPTLKVLQQKGYLLIIITNQSGIGRGYYNEEDALSLFQYMKEDLKKYGVEIAKIYYCPHFQEDCTCRKPKLGLFYQAIHEFNIDPSGSYAVGDKLRDLEICHKEAIQGFYIGSKIEKTGNWDHIIRCPKIEDILTYIK